MAKVEVRQFWLLKNSSGLLELRFYFEYLAIISAIFDNTTHQFDAEISEGDAEGHEMQAVMIGQVVN